MNGFIACLIWWLSLNSYVCGSVDLRLGYAGALTADSSTSSTAHRESIAVMMAIDEINSGQAFGIPNNPILPQGYNLSLYINDTQNNIPTACQITNTLINTNHVIGIIGTWGSAISMAMATFAGVFQVPIISSSSSSNDLSNKALYPYFSRVLGASRQQCAASIDLVLSLGWRTATMLYTEESYGQTQSSTYQQAAKDLLAANRTSIQFTNVLSFPPGNTQKLKNALLIIKDALTTTNVVILGMQTADYLSFIAMADQLGLIGRLHIVGTSDVSVKDLPPDQQTYYKPLLQGVISTGSTFIPNDITTHVGATCRSWSGLYGSSWCNAVSFDRWMYFAYDDTYLYAYALKQVIELNQQINGPNILTQIRNVSFIGATGLVHLDSSGDRYGTYGVVNYRPDTSTFDFVGYVDPLQHVVTVNTPILWNDGTTNIPLDHEPIPPIPLLTTNQALQIPLYVFAFVVFVLIAAVAVLILVKRQVSLFKAASVPFCLFMLFFDGVLALSSMLYATQPDGQNINARFVCYGRPWFTGVCLTGLLAALLIKGSRIDRLFNAKKLQINVGSNWQLAAKVGIMVMIQIAILIGLSAATLTEPQLVLGKHASAGYRVYQCASIESDSFIAWLAVEIAFFAIMLLYGIRLAFRLRNVPSSFNESQQISHSIACLAFFLILLVPLQFIVQDDPNALILIRGYGQALGSLMLCVVNFGPKVYLYLTARDIRYRSNTSQHSNETHLSNGSTGHTGYVRTIKTPSTKYKHEKQRLSQSSSIGQHGPLNEGNISRKYRSSMSMNMDEIHHIKQQHDTIFEIIQQRMSSLSHDENKHDREYEILSQLYHMMKTPMTNNQTGIQQTVPETNSHISIQPNSVSPNTVQLTIV